jgi:hypothetical protein
MQITTGVCSKLLKCRQKFIGLRGAHLQYWKGPALVNAAFFQKTNPADTGKIKLNDGAWYSSSL